MLVARVWLPYRRLLLESFVEGLEPVNGADEPAILWARGICGLSGGPPYIYACVRAVRT